MTSPPTDVAVAKGARLGMYVSGIAGTTLFSALRDHVGYLYFMHPGQQSIATAADMRGMKNPAMIFTAPDCAQLVSRGYPQLQQNTVGGEALFAWLRGQGVDGIILYPLGPGATVACDISI